MSIIFDHVSFAYSAGTPFEHQALDDVSFTIPEQQFTALVGQTGSGKSTAIKHLAALVKPTAGTVTIKDLTLKPDSKGKILRDIRKHVGIVFQFPESQLFEETVLRDVMFGPKNYGASEEEAEQLARQALQQVGIKEELFERAPFDLSGGQMRRVAIAGVLAMSPDILILDEPTAGLDPKGQREMMTMFYDLYKEKNITVILVTHQMNDVAEYADHVVVMENKQAIREGNPREIFSDGEWLEAHHLNLPDTYRLAAILQERGLFQPDEWPLRFDELIQEIKARKGGEDGVE
ncbi:energy-coupling factor transporter ATPase [Aerococcus vaginalis]